MVFVALGFLFQCGKSDDSAKDVDPPLVTLKFSAPGITFNDVSGATGATYTVSASHPPSAGKTIEVTLTSASEFLEVSPTKVTFTPANASPQTITVKRENGAADFITTEITGTINHVITTDTEFAKFAMMESTVNVMVTPTPSNVRLNTPEITFNDVSGAVGATYTISVSRPPSAEKTVEVTLTSTNALLEVSPTVVTFTPVNYASPQTITVKRANDANDVITADIRDVITHAITTGASADTEFTEFAMMKSTVNVRVTPYMPDSDGDGLIEIWTAAMLNNMRYDLAGTSYKTSAMDAGNDAGCPDTGCNGYELMASIDLLGLLDANGNDKIDTKTETVAGVVHKVVDVSKDTGWVPVGDNANRFTGTFEGNGNTIANLWVNISGRLRQYAGLFGRTRGTTAIRNVGVISGGVFSMATRANATDSFSSSGGLVGSVASSSSLTITNSYFSSEGGVSASVFSTGAVLSSSFTCNSGGLVGEAFSLTITNSYFSGSGGISSSVAAFTTSSGGLVGFSSSLMVTNSYFSGSGGVSVSTYSSLSSSGGLVGSVAGSSSLTIRNSYWNTDQISRAGGTGAVGLTLAELQATSGTYPNLLGDAWDLGTDQQLPAVKRCILDMAGVCASYAALLGGQR